MAWTEPKIDWNSTDRINIADFNRIKNNLEYLYDCAREMYPVIESDSMGSDMDDYSAFWNVAYFNAFETNLKKLDNLFPLISFGDYQTFYGNGQFIKYDELNRIESAMITIKDLLERQQLGTRHIPFTLGRYKEVRI